MKMKRLGRTGLHVSEICLGTMTFGKQADESVAFRIMDTAAAGGVNFIDTADVYPVPVAADTRGRTEEIVGKWLKGRRDNFILATKCRAEMGPLPWNGGLSRKHILQAVEDSLRRLQTDYIDLYQTHSPDTDTPIDETLAALDVLVKSGKVRYIGCSNYGTWRLAEALWTSDKLGLTRYDCVQPRYNLLFRQIEDELLTLCKEQGVGVIAYNPLAGGFLTGKFKKDAPPETGSRFDLMKEGNSLYHERYWKDAQFNAVEKLANHFENRNINLAQAAIAWVLQNQVVTSAIVGASKPEQLAATLPSVSLILTKEDLEVCNAAWYSIPRPMDPTVALR